MSRLPDFVIIGAMKCGTSSLHEQLAAQPGFFMSDPKEPNFFSDDTNYERGFDWYRGLFAGAGADALVGESSTHYTKLPTYPATVARLKERLPDVRLVYVMRHPISRLVSQYIHEWTEGATSDPIDVAVRRLPRIVDYSRYAMQLTPYFEAYGTDRVLPVFLERMHRDPQEELTRVARFLGYGGEVRWRTDLGEQNVSAERLRVSAWRDALTDQPVLAWLRRHLVPQGVRDRIKSLWQMKRRPELSAETEAELAADLDRDLATLGDWLGLKLTCATYKDVVLGGRAPNWAD
ncbi:sulfotransferase family protein [Mucisphaera sp.]|uniref:sulfotransferase family protein n=1 Tax=Mucisphaera sp. TaxID=2913024 RepID=UPI003D0F7097